MLKEVIESTKAFVETMPKAQRKAYGQFFTTELAARFRKGQGRVERGSFTLTLSQNRA